MDSFIKIIPQKKERPPTLHHHEIELLEKYVSQGHNVFVCGPTGCGKSFVVDTILNHSNTIELHSELFQKKSSFMNLIGDTSYHILIDGYDPSIHGQEQSDHFTDWYKRIMERYSEVEFKWHTKKD